MECNSRWILSKHQRIQFSFLAPLSTVPADCWRLWEADEFPCVCEAPLHTALIAAHVGPSVTVSGQSPVASMHTRAGGSGRLQWWICTTFMFLGKCKISSHELYGKMDENYWWKFHSSINSSDFLQKVLQGFDFVGLVGLLSMPTFLHHQLENG